MYTSSLTVRYLMAMTTGTIVPVAFLATCTIICKIIISTFALKYSNSFISLLLLPFVFNYSLIVRSSRQIIHVRSRFLIIPPPSSKNGNILAYCSFSDSRSFLRLTLMSARHKASVCLYPSLFFDFFSKLIEIRITGPYSHHMVGGDRIENGSYNSSRGSSIEQSRYQFATRT